MESSSSYLHNNVNEEEEEEENRALEEIPVELGFAERVPRPLSDDDGEEDDEHGSTDYCAPDIAIASEKWSLWDGGKIGGRPIWLDTKHAPDKATLSCERCGKHMLFLMQIYAPLDEGEINHTNAFHRMLYVFICPKSSCVSEGSVLVLRCQLPQENEFFPAKAPDCDENRLLPQLSRGVTLCQVCGCAAAEGLSYCCDQHNPGDEARVSGGYLPLNNAIYSFFAILPEFEVVTEPEPSANERRKFLRSKYQSLDDTAPSTESEGADDPDISSLTQEELLNATGASIGADKSMRYFKDRISIEPEQVVRYSKWQNEAALWAGYDGRPSHQTYAMNDSSLEKVEKSAACPPCPYCGQERKFEFQVMPQIISLIGDAFEDSAEFDQSMPLSDLDFGTLVIYSCTGSCTADSTAYKREYAWTQLLQ